MLVKVRVKVVHFLMSIFSLDKFWRFLVLNKSSVKLLFLIIGWYLTSSLNNVIGKNLLRIFPYPMSLTFVQLLSISVYATLLRGKYNYYGADGRKGNLSIRRNLKILLPLGVGKFTASVFSHFSIWLVSVSYAHTVKATMPLFTVLFARILLGEKNSYKIYLSLFPIILGVTIATVTELSFDMFGLVCALCATCGFALQNIFSKKLLKDSGIHQFHLLAVLARISLVIFLPIWIWFDVTRFLAHPINTEIKDETPIFTIESMTLLYFDGLFNFLQNIFAFTVLSLISPLSYSVVNASKRIAIIAISLFALRNPVTWLNVFGISVAIGGVFLYIKVKHWESRNPDLPVIVKPDDLNFNYMKFSPQLTVPPLSSSQNYYSNNSSRSNGTLHSTSNKKKMVHTEVDLV